MLDAALATLDDTGLTVSLEHIRLEDLIRDADVSRTAVYRCWPHKDLFLGDLVLELARAGLPAPGAGGREATALVRRAVTRDPDRLASTDERWSILVDLVREGAWSDFRHDLAQARRWRTYLALLVTLVSLPPGELREQTREAIATSEREYVDRLAAGYQQLAELLGFEPVDPKHVPFERLAQLAIATMRGLVVRALADPTDGVTPPTDEAVAAAWTLPALGLTALVRSYLRVDRSTTWDRRRIEEVCQQLERTEDLFA